MSITPIAAVAVAAAFLVSPFFLIPAAVVELFAWAARYEAAKQPRKSDTSLI